MGTVIRCRYRTKIDREGVPMSSYLVSVGVRVSESGETSSSFEIAVVRMIGGRQGYFDFMKNFKRYADHREEGCSDTRRILLRLLKRDHLNAGSRFG